MTAWRRALVAVALVCGSLAFSLGALELAFHLLGIGARPPNWQTGGLFRPDPELIYSLVPNARVSWTTAEFVERVRVDAAGLRGAEIAPKRSGEQRIIVLGDSMTFGHGVADDEAFPSQLEGILRAEGRDVEVLNAGTQGYGSDQEFKLFATRLRRLEPDLVIFCLYANDVLDDIHHPLYTIQAGELAPLDGRRDYLFRLGSFLAYVPPPLRGLRTVRFAAERLAARGAWKPKRELPVKHWLRWSQEKFALEVRALKAMGETDGFAVLAVGLPSRAGGKPYGWVGRQDLGGVAFLDLSQRPPWSQDRRGLFFVQDTHLNAKGCRRVAEDLARYLDETGAARGGIGGPGR